MNKKKIHKILKKIRKELGNLEEMVCDSSVCDNLHNELGNIARQFHIREI